MSISCKKGLTNREKKGVNAYDQLHRLVQADITDDINVGNYNVNTSPVFNPLSQYEYDANGNMDMLNRFDSSSGTKEDGFSYTYQPNTNKLLQVNDNTSVDVNAPNSFTYDASGNLNEQCNNSTPSQCQKIEWTAYGKVNQVVNQPVSGMMADTITVFDYAPDQNRVRKTTANEDIFYVRDAQGNVMAIYELDSNGDVIWKEQYLYGSSRLGVHQLDTLLPSTLSGPLHVVNNGTSALFEGNKQYQLTNHLGNVLATVSDRKIPKETGTADGEADYYEAITILAQDYYPYGSVDTERTYNVGIESYRHKFNGTEEEPAIGADFNFTLYRMQDATRGRWWSLDPRPNPSVSPYAMMEGNPILYSDILGDTTRVYNMEGGLMSTINDNLPNEEHFFDDKQLGELTQLIEECTECGGDSNDFLGGQARQLSSFYVGEQTRKDFADIASLAEGTDGLERGFLVFKPEGSKELRITDITEYNFTQTKNELSFPVFREKEFGANPEKYTGKGSQLLGFGHVQTSAGLKNILGPQYRPKLNNPSILNDPTSPNDYAEIPRRDGVFPAFISTIHGYTIYSTSERTNSGNVFNNSGNLIISTVEH